MGFTVGQFLAQLEGDATYDHDFTDIPPMEMPDDPYYEPIRGVFASGNAGGTTLYRLREGIERFLITDINQPAASARAQSSVPVMWDYVAGNRDVSRFNHVPGGANVLYMDGHVEFIRYPGKFPVTPWNVLMESYGQPGADNPGEG
jgi:prepilin-type processing-associated H-X9-DG protein